MRHLRKYGIVTVRAKIRHWAVEPIYKEALDPSSLFERLRFVELSMLRVFVPDVRLLTGSVQTSDPLEGRGPPSHRPPPPEGPGPPLDGRRASARGWGRGEEGGPTTGSVEQSAGLRKVSTRVLCEEVRQDLWPRASTLPPSLARRRRLQYKCGGGAGAADKGSRV